MQNAKEEDIESDLEKMNATLHTLRKNHVKRNRRSELLKESDHLVRKTIVNRLLSDFVYQLVDTSAGLQTLMKIPETKYTYPDYGEKSSRKSIAGEGETKDPESASTASQLKVAEAQSEFGSLA